MLAVCVNAVDFALGRDTCEQTRRIFSSQSAEL